MQDARSFQFGYAGGGKSQVFFEHRKVVLNHPRRESRRGRPECRSQVALRIDVDRQDSLARLHGKERQRGGYRATTRASLSGYDLRFGE